MNLHAPLRQRCRKWCKCFFGKPKKMENMFNVKNRTCKNLMDSSNEAYAVPPMCLHVVWLFCFCSFSRCLIRFMVFSLGFAAGIAKVWTTSRVKSSWVSLSFHFYTLALRTQDRHILRLLTGIFCALRLRRHYCHCVNLQEDTFVAHFKYHMGAITSIEWSPHEASTLSVTSADHQLTYEYSPL